MPPEPPGRATKSRLQPIPATIRGDRSGQAGKCRVSCNGRCGDGSRNGTAEEETCDLGDDGAGAYDNGDYGSGCDANCQEGGPRCGDDILQTANESCERNSDGTIIFNNKREHCVGESDGATWPCACRVDSGDCHYCGDGFKDIGPDVRNPLETCERGDVVNGNHCRNDCTICGDGNQDAGEECDEGDDNGEQPGDCRPNCSGWVPVPEN